MLFQTQRKTSLAEIPVRLLVWLVLMSLSLLVVSAQCQPAAAPTPSPTPQATSTPVLIPPIQPGDGTDVIDRVLESGVLRVGIHVWPEANFSPPAFRGASNAITGGALNGFEVDIAHLVAENMGLELELVEAPPRVIASGTWYNQWDIALASLVPFDQPVEDTAAHTLRFTQPYAFIPMGILIPATQENIQTPDQLAGRRVGVLEHSAYQRLFTPTEEELTAYDQALMPEPPAGTQLVIVSNLPKAIRLLGQPTSDEDSPPMDAIFGPAPMFEEAIKNELPVKLATDANSIGNIGVQPLVIAAVPQDELTVDRLISEINKILTRLQRQGTLAEVYFRWYGQDFSQPP